MDNLLKNDFLFQEKKCIFVKIICYFLFISKKSVIFAGC